MTLLLTVLALFSVIIAVFAFLLMIYHLSGNIVHARLKRRVKKIKEKKKVYKKPTSLKTLEKNLQKEREDLYKAQDVQPLANQLSTEIDFDNTQITGIRKPLGKWTRMVMARSLGHMKSFYQMYNKSTRGFWVHMVGGKNPERGKISGGRGRG